MFSSNLKKLRLENKMTQKELGQRLKVSDKTINHWENKYLEPDIETLRDLKNLFNVSYEELLDD